MDQRHKSERALHIRHPQTANQKRRSVAANSTLGEGRFLQATRIDNQVALYR